MKNEVFKYQVFAAPPASAKSQWSAITRALSVRRTGCVGGMQVSWIVMVFTTGWLQRIGYNRVVEMGYGSVRSSAALRRAYRVLRSGVCLLWTL